MDIVYLFNILANLLESERDLYDHFSDESIQELKDLYKNSSRESQMTVYYRFNHVLSALFSEEQLEAPLINGFITKIANKGDIVFIQDNERNPDLTGLFFECVLSLEEEILILDSEGEIRPIQHEEYLSYIPVDTYFKILDDKVRKEMLRRDIERWDKKGLSWFEISEYEEILTKFKEPNEQLIKRFTDKHSFYYMEGLKQPKSEFDLLIEQLNQNIKES